MTVLTNSLEGGTDGTAITNGNSGGDSGSRFDVVNSSGTVEYDTGVTINDAISARLVAGATQSPFLRWDGTSWPGGNEAWFRKTFRVSDATPASNFTIVSFKEADTTTTGCDVQLTTDGKIRLRAPFTTRYTSTYTVTADTPVRVEVHVLSHASAGHIEARLFYGANLNGTTPDETLGDWADNWNTGDGTIGAVNFGCVSTPAQDGYEMWLDGIGLGDEGWLGPESYTPPPAPSAEISYVGAGTGVTGTGDITPVYPGGYTAVAGDVAVVHVNVTVTDTGEYTTPAGWTKVGTILNEMGGTDGRLTVYMKRLTASESLPTITGDTVDQFVAVCEIFRGVDADVPLDGVTVVTSEANNTLTFTPTGVTTTTDGAWVISSVGIPANGGDADITTTQGFTLGPVEFTTSGANVTVGSAHKLIATAGAVTFPTWEKTQFTGIGQWCGVSFALRPGVAGPPPSADTQQYIGIFGGGDAPEDGGGGPPPSTGVSSLLVPDEGAWFGGTTPALNDSGTSASGLSQWLAEGCRRPQIFPWYKTGSWNGVPTSGERSIFDPGGSTPYAIPKYSWKVGSGSGSNKYTANWTEVANGDFDAEIDACADGIKTFEHKMFFSVWHEPEDNVNSPNNTRAAYRAMWQRVRDRFEARGVDNVVYLLQFAGYWGHAVNGAGSGFEDMYPGDDYIDWLGMDPYTHDIDRNTLDDLVNWTNAQAPTGYTGWYNWAQANHPTKPIMLGEFGAGNTGVQGASTKGVQFTDAQGASVVNDWISDLGVTNTNIKAFLYWNGRALGKYDYQIQRAGREQYADAVAAMSNDSYFDQDTELARAA